MDTLDKILFTEVVVYLVGLFLMRVDIMLISLISMIITALIGIWRV